MQVERGTQLKIALGGTVTVRVADETHVSGQIQLKSGTVDVQGKPFEIEKGIVTFVGTDPSNPDVVITAGWTAPDGTRVFADFNGSVKSGRVTLRSSPRFFPHGQVEVKPMIAQRLCAASSKTSSAMNRDITSGSSAR